VNDPLERELKLVPADSSLLDELARAERLGELVRVGQRRERQRNSFFDTASRALSRARVGFRRRGIEGERLATWTLKSDAKLVGGVATRAEVELQLEPGMPPALAIGALQEAARSRGAAVLAEQVADALAAGGLPLAQPFLEMETDRVVVDFAAAERGWAVELALDHVRLVGHAYAEVEIEAELKRGDEAALQAAGSAIAALGSVHPSHGSKLSRAMAHLAACRCQACSAS
jgi:inorganic triphosphatase YgiF